MRKKYEELVTLVQDDRFLEIWGGVIKGRDKHRNTIKAAENVSNKTISVRYPIHPDPIENSHCRKILRWVKDTIYYVDLFGIDLVTGIAQLIGSRLISEKECRQLALEKAKERREELFHELDEINEEIKDLENGGEK